MFYSENVFYICLRQLILRQIDYNSKLLKVWNQALCMVVE